MKEKNRRIAVRSGFTIVELLIVVVVIAILAVIIVISFNGITTQAKESSLKSDLSAAAKQLHIVKVESGNFPDSTSGVRKSDSTTFQYDSTANTFCLTATNPTDLPGKAFHIRESGGVQSGACSGHAVGGGGESNEIAANSPIQNVTQAQCQALPTFDGSNDAAVRTVTDARGDTPRTYEIAKLADGKCWMLTNLKLGSTSGSITLTPSDSDVATNFTLPRVTTDGTSELDLPRAYGPIPGDTSAANTNYGYLYNWAAATAGESDPPAGSILSAQHSICPAGWRLPIGVAYDDLGNVYFDEIATLDQAFGGTGNEALGGGPSTPRWNYPGAFKGVLSGGRLSTSFTLQGAFGSIWSSSAAGNNAVGFGLYPEGVNPTSFAQRSNAAGIRCLLN